MFLSAWSLSLFFCSIIVLFLGTNAVRTGIRVLRFWNPDSDSNLQIRLENETWLASTLVEYALVVQGFSLLLFILAADNYSQVIAGAMCATGSLLANQFGMPTLYLKLAGVFLYGFWILLHQMDIRSESYPLVRIKFAYLLILVPVVIFDIILQTLYIANLTPDIITSCCAVVFSDSSGTNQNLFSSFLQPLMLGLYYGTMVVLAVMALLINDRLPRLSLPGGRIKMILSVGYSAGWLWFFGLALLVITTTISSYIYAMPFHRCPFCIIKPEYHYIGIFIYSFLIVGTFFGITVTLAELISRRRDLAETAGRFRKTAIDLSLLLLLLLAIFTSYHYLIYMIIGGET